MSKPWALARLLAPGVALAVVWLVSTNHGPFSSTEVSDLYLYGVYARTLGDGLIPYLDFDFEYPPVALVPLGLLGDHAVAFSLAMLGCALICQECARRISGEKAAWAMVALPVLAGAQVRTHFDLFVTALVMLALVSSARGTFSGAFGPRMEAPSQARSAGVLLGIATAAKLWPGLVAAAVLRDRRNWVRFAAVTIPLGLITLALGGWSMVEFHVQRPIQIESTPSTVLSLLPVDVSTTGDPITSDGFKSNGTDASIAWLVGAIFLIFELAAIAWFVWKADRLRGGFHSRARDRASIRHMANVPGASHGSRECPPSTDVLAALGVTLAFVAFGKVLSPQFMLWLFPLAIAAWGWPALLVAAATALTQVEFPTRYFDLVFREDQTVIAVVAARNALLVIALFATARALARSSPPVPAASSG